MPLRVEISLLLVAFDAVTEKITNIMNDKSEQLDDIKFNDGDLNKLNQAFTD